MSTKVASVKAELDDYIKKNTDVITTGVYAGDVQIDEYCKRVSKVKGKFPQYHKVMTRVVQGFKAEWQKLGEMQFNAKVLRNFRQKVNYEIIVDEVYNTWLSDLKIEGKKPQEQPISKVIVEELLEKVIDDLSDLSIIAQYDEANASGQFGFSLDGIGSLIKNIKTNTKYPCFKIPLDVITDANVLDQFKRYEMSIPKKVRKKVTPIFCSEDLAERYADAIVEKYGKNTDYNDSRTMKTEKYGIEIVGLQYLPDDIIFSTKEDNLLKLVDVIDNPPQITDTQIHDYVLKIFMEFHLGYDFAINELVYVADFSADAEKGLGDPEKNKLYYPMENLRTKPSN